MRIERSKVHMEHVMMPDSYGTCLCLLMTLRETQILFRSKLGWFSAFSNLMHFRTCREQRQKACTSMFVFRQILVQVPASYEYMMA